MGEQGGERPPRLPSLPEEPDTTIDLADLDGVDVELPVRLAEADALSARALLDYLEDTVPEPLAPSRSRRTPHWLAWIEAVHASSRHPAAFVLDGAVLTV